MLTNAPRKAQAWQHVCSDMFIHNTDPDELPSFVDKCSFGNWPTVRPCMVIRYMVMHYGAVLNAPGCTTIQLEL